jgi:hypothetical protein
MLREVDKFFLAMCFEPGPFTEGAAIGLGRRGGELLIKVNGGEFVSVGDGRFVHRKLVIVEME